MADVRIEPHTVREERGMKVFKKNELVQKTRYSLTMNQQKTLLYLISLIKEGDNPAKVYSISISRYCEIAGIEKNDVYYQRVREDIQQIADASVWIQQENGIETLVRWIGIVNLDGANGSIDIMFSESIRPYLFFMRQDGNYTRYPLINVLSFHSRYTIRIYELLKSYAFMGEYKMSIQDLKIMLGIIEVENIDGEKVVKDDIYKNFSSFRKKVLDRAMDEINQYSDIKVQYALIKEGKSYVQIHFAIGFKNEVEQYITRREQKKILDKPPRKKEE